LREAQDAFNDAAVAESACRFDPLHPLVQGNASDAVSQMLAARCNYARALSTLNQLENEDAQRLREDKLLGTALTLKALSQWRLGDYEGALRTAEKTQAEAQDQVYSRDLALLKALPGLIKAEQGYEKVTKKQPFKDVEELLVGPRGAVNDLRGARGCIDKDHPVQVYLIQAQLAAYRTYQVAHLQLQGKTVAVDDVHLKDAKELLGQLRGLVEHLSAKEQADKLVIYWSRLFGWSVPGS